MTNWITGAAALLLMLNSPARTIRCSWYGEAFEGRSTASGIPFHSREYTCAHRTLPLGSIVLLETTHNTVMAQVTDRGPYATDSTGMAVWPLQPHPTREMDLSMQAAKRLGIVPQGVGSVQIRLIGRVPVGYMSQHSAMESGMVPQEASAEKDTRDDGYGEWVESGRKISGTGETHRYTTVWSPLTGIVQGFAANFGCTGAYNVFENNSSSTTKEKQNVFVVFPLTPFLSEKVLYKGVRGKLHTESFVSFTNGMRMRIHHGGTE